MPDALFLFPEGPDHGVHCAFSALLTPLVECVAWLDRESKKLVICSRKSEIVDDIIEAATCQRMERSESNLSHYRILHCSLSMLSSAFIGYGRKRMAFFRLFFALDHF